MDPADSGRWQMVRGVLEAHGYEEPIFIGEGSFAKVYRVRDKEGCFGHAEYRNIQDNGSGNAETGRRSGIRFFRCTESNGHKTGWDI